MENRKPAFYPVGNRIALLRSEKGYTQKQFCDEFSTFIKKSKSILVPTVSSWEKGHRLPTLEVLVSIARFYNVSMDYLIGITDVRNNTNNKSVKSSNVDIESYPITTSNMMKYDNQPVYVEYENSKHPSCWGILDYYNKRIITSEEELPLSSKIKVMSRIPFFIDREPIVSFSTLIKEPYIYVIMKTSDRQINETYNGIYRKTEDSSFMQNITNGLLLPYSGYDVTYWAYKG